MIFLNTAIALMAGPASAIFMISDEGWFPHSRVLIRFLSPYYYYHRPWEKTWPLSISATQMGRDCQLLDCRTFNVYNLVHIWCPNRGFRELSVFVVQTLHPSLPADATFEPLHLHAPVFPFSKSS